MKRTLLLVIVVLFCMLYSPANLTTAAEEAEAGGSVFSEFSSSLDEIRQILKIPGMSAAVVRDQELVWARGFGYADLENQVEAGPDTPYGLASVTKPVAATLIMQLVQERVIDLDAPISNYGVQLEADGVVTVRHLLTHTSEGVPGTVHNYNGDRYGHLGGVIEGATGKTFARLLGERFLLPLGMTNTALNPFSIWGGSSRHGFEDFSRSFGWGEPFRHYPDVYQRLSHPYQFDPDYNIIPGMYHLYHNPAAGMVSSVTDLAKFDIALDQGTLLGDEALAEMFTPAYGTYEGREDLMYGLGWYTQDYEGLRLIWHTGRWPPSTSALYLKVPEENLTFIILANTDNLTTPFYSIGNGDITTSTLALSFLRHFVFPRQYGYSPPSIDWGASLDELVHQLSAVEDEASRVFLERELWSFRQTFASAGGEVQVNRLEQVNRLVYRKSEFRGDPMYTATSGDFPVIPPVVRAATFVWLSRVTVVWLGLVILSIGYVIMQNIRKKGSSPVQLGLWVLAAVFMGPVALLVRTFTSRKAGLQPAARWRQALGAAAFCTSGYAAAWVVAIVLMYNIAGEPHPLVLLGVTYLIPFAVGLLFIRGPFLRRYGLERYSKALSRGVVAEVLTLNLGYAFFFPLTMLMDSRVLSIVPHPTSPYFWPMMGLITSVGLVALFPLHYWMGRRGYVIWPVGDIAEGPVEISLPTLRNSWGMVVITLGIVVGALGMTVSQLG